MENEEFLPCKSCGKLLSLSAASCPNCGEPAPFGINKAELKEIGLQEGKKLNRIKKVGFWGLLVLAVVLYNSTHIIWLTVVGCVAWLLFFPILKNSIERRLINNADKNLYQFYGEYSKQIKKELSDEDGTRWWFVFRTIYCDALSESSDND